MAESVIKHAPGLTYESWVEQLGREKVKKHPSYRWAIAGGLASLALIVAGCSTNYEGDGDEFEVQGQVIDVGERSVNIRILRVIEAEGDARSRYLDNGESIIGKETRVHDNYQGGWCEENTVGQEFGLEGQVIDLREIKQGDLVDIIGNIRESKKRCGGRRTGFSRYEKRPVYEEVRLIQQAQIGVDFDLIRPQDSGYNQ